MLLSFRKGLTFTSFSLMSAMLMAGPVTADESFQRFIEGVKTEGMQRGIRTETLNAALGAIQPVARVLELDQKQPEFSRTFWGYLDVFVTEQRIQRGREMLELHRPLLEKVAAQYGVQPRFLVAFWGMETNFGDYTGGFDVIDALATLAHDPRRSDFFRNELFNALKILDEGHIDLARMQGSWAGAMGQPQFMPSTFTGYAIDGDGDGRKDIWTTLPDVFASAAHYLSKIGWDDRYTWGREVRLPQNFNLELADINNRQKLDFWRAQGVVKATGAPLPNVDIEAALILPAGVKGPAFLVYQNFDAIMKWNRSIFYALGVGYLSDRIVGKRPIVAQRPENDAPLPRADIMLMQQVLTQKGFDTGGVDGMLGPMTRAAVKAYQRAEGLPPDGYPDTTLIERIKGS